jgi:hypothetical protein
LLRAVLVFVALLALAPLIVRITGAKAVAPAVEQPAVRPAGPRHVEVALAFSLRATRVSISHLGREVWAKAGPSLEDNAAIELPWPKEGVELRVKVEWPEGSPAAAMRVRLAGPDGREHDRTVWGRGAADEVLLFE